MNNILPFKKLSTIFFSLLILTNLSLLSQVSIIDENAVLISFDGYNGSGFSPDPATGQLDSDTWSVLGLSDGDLNFGDTDTVGDFARGISSGKVSTGGCYAFDIGSDNIALGVQPGGSDWTPGDLILKVQNNTGNNIITLNLSYSLWVYNDKPRANSFNFSHSPNNSDYTKEPTLNFTSPDTTDSSPAWTETIMDIDLNDLNIPDGSNYYLKWTGDDISGSGSRDEFAIDNITITATLGEADSDPPAISTYDPVNGAIDVSVNKILSFSFDEDVQKGSGNIVVRYSSDNTEFETMDINEPEVVVTGTDVTIDLVGDFDEDKEYYVLIDAGTFKDMANNNFVGISDPATWEFTTIDETPPEFIETYPKISNESNTQFDIVVQLNEVGHIYYIVIPDGSKTPGKDQVKARVDYDTVILITSGSFEVTAPGTGFSTTVSGLDGGTGYDVYLVAEDDATTPNLQDTPAKSEVTTTSNPSLVLTYPTGGETFYHSDTVEVTWNSEFIDNVRLYISTDGTGYFIIEESADAATGMLELIVPNNAGTDDLLIRIASALDTTLYDESGYFHLTDTLDPEIDSLAPSDNATNISLYSRVKIYFNEDIEKGNGTISIVKKPATTIFETFNITGDSVYLEGKKIVLYPSQPFDPGTEYYIIIDSAAIKDMAGNVFRGIKNDTIYNFTTICSELFISEYIEGSSNNKAIELYNNSGATIDLSGYALWIIYNGGDWSEGESNAVVLEGSLEHGDVFVICNANASDDIQAIADSVGSQAVSFNGNDAIGLAKKVDENWILIDVVGNEGENPGTGWEVAGVPEATMNHTLLRKTSVQMGNKNWTTSAGTNTGDSEWRVFGQDFIRNLGESTPDGNSETEILTIELYDTTMHNVTTNVSIDSMDYTVEVEVLYGTEPDFLIPVFTLSDGATIDSGSGDTLDFTNPVTFTVIAEDSLTIQEWTIKVNVETVPGLSIYDIQYTTDPSGDSPHLGEKVRVSGIVTAIDTSQSLFKGFFLQETTKAWNGIYVSDPGRNSTQTGDSLTLVATVSEQDNMTHISGIIEYLVNSKDNNLPVPLELATGEAGEEQYEGVLITIENAECIDSIPGSVEFELDDGSGLIRVDNYLYPYEPFLLNNIYHVTGVICYSDGNWKIFPRTAEDISNVTAINETGVNEWINIFPNPNNGRFNLEITGNYSFEAEIQIMNTLGQVVYRSHLNSSSNHREVIDLTNLVKGLYFLKVSNGTHVKVRKILIR